MEESNASEGAHDHKSTQFVGITSSASQKVAILGSKPADPRKQRTTSEDNSSDETVGRGDSPPPTLNPSPKQLKVEIDLLETMGDRDSVQTLEITHSTLLDDDPDEVQEETAADSKL